jgi:hypothetical protein
MDVRRETLSKLVEAHRKLDRRLDAAKDPAEMRRLITIRKGLRLVMEPLAERHRIPRTITID